MTRKRRRKITCPRCGGTGDGKRWIFCSLCDGDQTVSRVLAGAYLLISIDERPDSDCVRELRKAFIKPRGNPRVWKRYADCVKGEAVNNE
jgi:hypothetical protein